VTPRTPLLRAQPRAFRRRLELIIFRLLLAQTLQSERVRRRSIRRRRVLVLERVEEGRVRGGGGGGGGGEISRASARVAKVQSWRGRRAGGGAPALERGAALEGETRVEEAVLERVVARWRGLARELEEVHADEDDDEADHEGYRVHGVVGVEALEEDEGRDDGGRRKANLI